MSTKIVLNIGRCVLAKWEYFEEIPENKTLKDGYGPYASFTELDTTKFNIKQTSVVTTPRKRHKMKDLLQRSISSYHSSQHTNMPLFTRHVSVPCDIYRQNVYNEEAGSSPRQTALSATVSHQVMACVEDAAASISKVCTTILHHPESITPDFSPEHFQPLLRDAEILEPGIAYLVTKKKPDALSVVKDILSKMQQEYPHLEPQYLSSAIKAVENASILLHLPRSSNVNVQVTQPRAIIAVTMIVNKYLNNLTHSNFK